MIANGFFEVFDQNPKVEDNIFLNFFFRHAHHRIIPDYRRQKKANSGTKNPFWNKKSITSLLGSGLDLLTLTLSADFA